jgi:hypothetical protein
MSDSGRDNGKLARHPCSVAFDDLRERRPSLFDGAAEGRYLANRLQEAFQEGWLACQRRATVAMEGRE